MIKTVFQTLHNPKTVIRVVHGRDAGDGSKGLDVLVSGVIKARFYTPQGVTDWFEKNSKANVEGWKFAYHNSGLTNDDYAKPESKDVVLDVPFYGQRDNLLNPLGTCNVTSMAMIHKFHGVARKAGYEKYRQREDELSAWLKDHNLSRHAHADLVTMNRAYGLHSSFSTNRSWDQIRAEIRAGRPVVMAGKFTKSGHIIVLRGTSGNDFIVNDPYGNGPGKYHDPNGEGLKYTLSYLDSVTPYPGESGIRGHFNSPVA